MILKVRKATFMGVRDGDSSILGERLVWSLEKQRVGPMKRILMADKKDYIEPMC